MARAELEVARSWGVPRSVFLGRVVAKGEPVWLDTDRDYALALHFLEQETCGGCGQPRTESTDPANEFGYTATPERCHSCATISRSQRTFLTDAPAGLADGVTFHVTKDGS